MSTQDQRKAWMSLMAKAPPQELARLWDSFGTAPSHTVLRSPEVGGVMVRGRTGATGAPFNLGEMTVTRCAVRLGSGEVGHSYVLGRDKGHATRAALIDALMQTPQAAAVRRAVLDPLTNAMAAKRATRGTKAAKTKVDFFTMARGED